MCHFTIVRLQNHIYSWFINSWFFLIIKPFLADWGVKKIQTKYKLRSLCFVKNWFYSKQFEYFLITKNSTNIVIQRKLCFIEGGVNSGVFFVSIQVWKGLAFHMKCLLITLSSCWTLQFCIKVFVLTL